MLKIKCINNHKAVRDNWNLLLNKSPTNVIFLTYEWQKIWWKYFGEGKKLHLLTFYHSQELVGIAPLNECHHILRLNGGEDVSDFLDIISLKKDQEKVWAALLNYITSIGARGLRLCNIPEASPSRKLLKQLCHRLNYTFSEEECEVSPYIDLPKTWDAYLRFLNHKKRHELQRKLRKIKREISEFNTYIVDNSRDLDTHLDSFFGLLRKSNPDKEKFLTINMEKFFREIFLILAGKSNVLLHIASADSIKIAATLSFLYQDELWLYNSGFDPKYRKLSPGFVLATLSIKEAIKRGLVRFDFLRGKERYKYDLGAVDKRVYTISIRVK